MRILGVDPGSRMTGVGIIEVNGDRVRPVYYGVIRAGDGEFTERLGCIFSGLQQLIREHHPEQAAIETVFVAHNAASAIKLGQARGAAVCAAISSPSSRPSSAAVGRTKHRFSIWWVSCWESESQFRMMQPMHWQWPCATSIRRKHWPAWQ